MLENINVSDFFYDFDLDELWDDNPTSGDARYIHNAKRDNLKVAINILQRDIKLLKDSPPEVIIENESVWNTKKAFDLCGLYMTDTPNEAIANYIINYLERRRDYLSKIAEAERMKTESFLRYILFQIYGDIPSELEYNKLKMMKELKR
jgi:hypothetical protein